jgi:flagellar basal-body rod protein FlgB
MDTAGIPLFSLISNRMSWLSARQSVLAENVANADTPNYIARDLHPMEFSEMVAPPVVASGAATTNLRHIAFRGSPAPGYQPENAPGEGGTPGGNVVSIEQEMIKLSDTQLQYQTASNLYQKAVNMFRTALGSRSN